MSLFDRFKKTKKIEPEAKKAKVSEKSAKAAPKEAPKLKKNLDEILQKPAKLTKRVEKKHFSQAYRILESPRVTEKSGMLADRNIYVFNVYSPANKQEIKKAVQDLYGVAVDKVNIVNTPRKARRIGKSEGFKPGFKKAMVKLAEGEKIEIMPR
ncbi:MAG: 50S ribosomal protein L23 [Candidatus Portnoybacteria bacterium]|nr:50S ribosomal protein L23 [Candidatus Portnoybacteria bacterium]